MRLVCPSCSAAYDVPDGLLGGRKAVRCVRCAYEWQPGRSLPPSPSPPPPLPTEPQDKLPPPASPGATASVTLDRRSRAASVTALDRLMATRPKPRRNMALATAWLASIAVVLLLIWAAYAWRAQVMAAWPPSIRLYQALGLAGPDR